MPEYLAPGVYVEEVELAPRAIQMASTSTTGFVGLSRRGPINKPTLVTNYGEFERFFGGFLSAQDYTTRRWLPYSVQGYFANGGSRGYIVRVAPMPRTDDEELDRENFAHVATAIIPTQQDARRSLSADAEEGDQKVLLAYSGGLETGASLVIGDGATAEVVRVIGLSDAIDVEPALANDHSEGEGVIEVEVAQDADTTLGGRPPNTAQATTLRVEQVADLEDDRWVRVGEGDQAAYVQLGNVPDATGPRQVPIRPALTANQPSGTPVTMAGTPGAAAAQLDGAVVVGATEITLSAVGGLRAQDVVLLAGADAASTEAVRLTQTPTAGDLTVSIEPATQFEHADDAEVTPLSFAATGPVTALQAGLSFAADIDVEAGDHVLVDEGASSEYVRLTSDLGPNRDASIDTDLRFEHAADASVRLVGLPEATTTLGSRTDPGATTLDITDADSLDVGDVIEILEGPQTEYAEVLAVNTAGDKVTISRPTRYAHRGAMRVRRLTGAFRVIAGPMTPDPRFYPEPGSWGNDIELKTEATSALTTVATAAAVSGDASVELQAVAGIERGTLLRFPGNAFAIVDRVEGRRVFLDGGAPSDLTPSATEPWRGQVSTQEFKLTVSYGGTDEIFDRLSIDKRHSRYFEQIVNRGSRTVHVEDLNESGVASLDGGPLAAERSPGGGSDGLAGVGPMTFVGGDNADADRRTGLYAMLNQHGVSIMTVPGITDETVQRGLISHCERARYRFAVLDSEEGASLDQVQKQRNLYDSQYAALYYPWLKVFDPLVNAQTYAPPSGYIAGIYARTDQDVGVHKAPANVVLRDVNDLQFTVGKGQQDVLNPIGINAIRAFRNRGIRVWGARTISSDDPWKYVNVRRLFIMLEQSIDDSTQYAVFEPNDLPLWNRLKASITAFLTVVWRTGALQGATAEEAFFVRCGLGETMIQPDIDAGQVIMVIGVAPVKPAEFVIFRIGQKAGPAPS